MNMPSVPELNNVLSWRTEPEIPLARQQELAQYLAISPDFRQNIYPFRGVRLTRADIEWLLVQHDDGRGPVDWNDEQDGNAWDWICAGPMYMGSTCGTCRWPARVED